MKQGLQHLENGRPQATILYIDSHVTLIATIRGGISGPEVQGSVSN